MCSLRANSLHLYKISGRIHEKVGAKSCLREEKFDSGELRTKLLLVCYLCILNFELMPKTKENAIK